MSDTPTSWSGRVAQRLTALTLATYGDVCHLCGRAGATTADHLVPRVQGGDNSIENLRPAHLSCNSRRGDMPLDQYRTRYPIVTGAPPSRRW